MGQEAAGPLNGPNNEPAVFILQPRIWFVIGAWECSELFALLLFSDPRRIIYYTNTRRLCVGRVDKYLWRAVPMAIAKRQQAHQHLLIRILQTPSDTLVLCTLSAAHQDVWNRNDKKHLAPVWFVNVKLPLPRIIKPTTDSPHQKCNWVICVGNFPFFLADQSIELFKRSINFACYWNRKLHINNIMWTSSLSKTHCASIY